MYITNFALPISVSTAFKVDYKSVKPHLPVAYSIVGGPNGTVLDSLLMSLREPEWWWEGGGGGGKTET